MKSKRYRPQVRKFVHDAPHGVFFGPDTGLFRLNHNETTGLMPAKLAKKIFLDDINAFSEYPSYAELHSAIAKYAGVPEAFVQTTNGSDDAIPKLTRLLFEGKKSVILTVPTFPTYERALRIEQVPFLPISYIATGSDFAFPMDAVLSAIKSGDTQGLIICNPSNPLGTGIGKSDIKKLADATREHRMPFLVDEAYLEFHGVSARSLLKTHPNVILLRTFSKTFGLAGLRLGYIIASPEIIEGVRKLTLPWEVNHAAVRAGLAVLKEKKYFLSALKKTLSRRSTLRKLFAKYGVKAFDSRANFIICKTPQMNRLVAILQKHKVVVKSMGPASGYLPFLADCFRISVPGPDIAQPALKHIEKALREFTR